MIKSFFRLLHSIQGLRYRGSVDLTQTTDDTRFGKDVLGTVKVGDVFMISKGGAYAGIYLEPADMLVCVAKSGNPITITWNYIQSNINGAVTIKGATEGSKDGANLLVSVDSIPVFSAATGRQITGSKIFIDGAGHLLPARGNTRQCLGSDIRKWTTVYANTFNGTDFNGTNFTGTTFKGTDFTGTTFTGTTFTGNAASASKWKTARTITVTGADTGSVTLDGSKNVTLNLTVAHTHNYAGSSSAGGAANSANKLNTNAGSKTQPVYFADGVPVVCTSLTGNATSADKLSTARTLTIGNTGKTFDGTANVSWSLGEIGAAAASHSHPYLPLSGGTMTGAINGVANSTTWIRMSHDGVFRMATAASNGSAAAALSIKTNTGSWGIGGLSGNDNLYFVYGSDANYNADNNTVNSSVYISSTGGIYGAVWNDYAEYRNSETTESGRCIVEVGDDTLKLSTKRLQPGAEIISDTFGLAIGETEECKTPIAVSGRVLAYPYEPLEKFRENIGKPICSGPNGTVSIMTDEEYQKFGYCAIGTISAIPDYEVWGSGNVKVNGRVWIKV